MRKFELEFTVRFKTIIEVPEGELVGDVVCDIEIPENDTVKYIADTYEVDICKEIKDRA